MNRYFFTLLCCLMIHYSYAQEVPMLDSTTVETPKAKALNKCIGQDNKIIYTQFRCQDNMQKAEDNWAENANLTYLMANKELRTTDIVSLSEKSQFNKQNKKDQSGMNMLKEAMKDKSLLEMFDDGIKALMIRQEILNSL